MLASLLEEWGATESHGDSHGRNGGGSTGMAKRRAARLDGHSRQVIQQFTHGRPLEFAAVFRKLEREFNVQMARAEERATRTERVVDLERY